MVMTTVAVPGDRLRSVDGARSGAGTYVRNAHIYASIAGVVHIVDVVAAEGSDTVMLYLLFYIVLFYEYYCNTIINFFAPTFTRGQKLS